MIRKENIDLNGCRLFYLEAPAGGNKAVILMHGYNWDSDIWIESKTIAELNEASINVYAMDVPGFPKSRSVTESGRNVAETDIFDALLGFIREKARQKELFLLGTSGSGYLALKFAEKHGRLLKGVIAVAPVDLDAVRLDSIKTRVIAIWGSEDDVIRDVHGDELRFRRIGETRIIEGAGHRPYIDRPDEFNSIITRFVSLYK